MNTFVEVAPPHSFVLISDLEGGETPAGTEARGIRATQSCIVVGCMMFADGPSRFTLCRGAEAVGRGQPSFSGDLETPSRVVALSTTEGTTLLEAPVSAALTRVRIWTNHPTEPDDVIIAVE